MKYERTTDTYILDDRKDFTFYLKYEKELDIEEFKAGRIITVRSLYGFAEELLGMDSDDVEDKVTEKMVRSGRCEADELIHYFWETAKYPSIVLQDLDIWLS